MVSFVNLLKQTTWDNPNFKSLEIFKKLKPFFIDHLRTFIEKRKKSQAGRPIRVDFGVFFDALYHLVDSGIKINCIPTLFSISKTTFLRYLRLLTNNNFIENIYQEGLNHIKTSNVLIVDSFLVKSMDGKEGTGRNPCDRGRRGNKVFIVCDENKIATHVIIEGANTSENNCLRKFLRQRTIKRKRILADSGFVGADIKKVAKENNYHLIVKPRKKRNGKLTHYLSSRDKKELDGKRNRIEHLNGLLRRFRGINNKYVKRLPTYRTLVFFAIVLITGYLVLE